MMDSPEFNREALERMLRDPSHPAWSESDFRMSIGLKLRSNPEEAIAIEDSLKMISETLGSINSLLEQQQRDYTTHQRRTDPGRFQWTMEVKARSKTLLDSLREEISDLGLLISLTPPKESRPATALVDEGRVPQSRQQVLGMMATQTEYEQLYLAIKPRTACLCHRLNIALKAGDDLSSQHEITSAERFVFCPTSLAEQWCWFIDVITIRCSTTRLHSSRLDTWCKQIAEFEELQPRMGAFATPFVLESLSGGHRIAYDIELAGCHENVGSVADLTLSHLLANSSNEMAREVLGPVQRFRLAYILSSSILKLYSTPWLERRQRWASKDIVFYPSTSSQQTSATFDPYLITPDHMSELEPGPEPAEDWTVKNYQIFALGVILLEIAHNFSARLSYSSGTRTADYADWEERVFRVLDRGGVARRSMGEEYAEVVSWCLAFGVGSSQASGERALDLQEPEHQRIFYHEVVEKLRIRWEMYAL